MCTVQILKLEVSSHPVRQFKNKKFDNQDIPVVDGYNPFAV